MNFWGFAQNCVVKLNTEEVVLCENPGLCASMEFPECEIHSKGILLKVIVLPMFVFFEQWHMQNSKMNSRKRQKRFCDVEYSYIVGN